MFETVITYNQVPITLINAMYRYYEDPKNKMTIGNIKKTGAFAPVLIFIQK